MSQLIHSSSQPFTMLFTFFSQLTEDLHQVLVEKQELLQQLRHDSTQALMTNLTQLNQKEQTLVRELYSNTCTSWPLPSNQRFFGKLPATGGVWVIIG